jgi:non-ribosomal peptide synthetase-like protein
MSLIDLPTLPARGPRESAFEPTSRTLTRLHRFFERSCDATPEAAAVVCDGTQLCYGELEARANQVAHLLIGRGIGPGARVGILLDRSIHTYVAMLGVLKNGAAFVPVDPSSPADRVAFVAKDAELRLLITEARRAPDFEACGTPLLVIDSAEAEIAKQPKYRPEIDDAGDAPCYIIYTSGTTGRPKGVLINHSSICNFLTVCGPVYGYEPGDRVYQGMTIAFDFSVEEIWPTFMAGARIVAGPNDHRRLGSGLAHFLIEQNVTVMCCVPTLLATLDRDVPSLRLLLVGGEACPHDLVRRWSRPGRRMLNTYGPTETTVTATWTELVPDKPVTIGRPLPTYTTCILDETLLPVPAGGAGELCIGGPGVAVGYLNRPELTSAQFIPDPNGRDANARLYRTGDLCRITPDGEIEYLGRIDGQVKVRGHRIELSEIESVLMEHAAVGSALVSKLTHETGDDLVAYVVLRQPAARQMSALRSELRDTLRRKLSAYMVPQYVEFLDQMPMLASGKADRGRLPKPALPCVTAHAGEHVAPATPLEHEIASAWATAFGHGELSVEADFFLDLGGHSLFAAGVISRLRRLPGLGQLSVADLYARPTIRALAEYAQALRTEATTTHPDSTPRLTHSRWRVWRCGMAQLVLIYLLMTALAGVAVVGLHLFEHRSWFQLIATGLAFGPAAWIAVSLLLPILVKWTVIGRFRPGRYPLWGFTFCRWWFVRNACALAPLELLAGSPLLAPYLRLLGARIGRNCHLGSGHLGTFDLLEIGDSASIGYGVELQPSTVEDGWLRLAPICIGAGAFVGTNSVLMPGATIGRGGVLLEQSLVSAGQTIPTGTIFGGSPAVPRPDAPATLRNINAMGSPPVRWTAGLLVGFVAMLCLLEILAFGTAASGVLVYAAFVDRFGAAGILPAALLAGPVFVLAACLAVWLLKRAITPAPRPGIFPARSVFGLRRWASDKLMEFSLGATNSLYATLYTNPWLRALGARVGARSEISTVSHVEPALLQVGSECFIADIATIGSPTYHNGWVGLGPVELGHRCFIGNASTVPADSRLGDDTLIGVSSVPPGPVVKEGSSWLGSPAMFLPNRQASETFDERLTFHPRAGQVAVRLAIEFVRVVLPSTLLYLMLFFVAYAMTHWAAKWPAWCLILALPAGYLGTGALVLLIVAALKWIIVGRYRPRTEPGWSLFVRRTELITGLYESAAVPAILDWLAGTPFLPAALRLFGTRTGAGVYLDTTYLTEFDLVEIGDGVQVGSNTSLQTHLFEDRVMKMSHVKIGPEASIGPRSVVLYDATVEAGARLDGLSLVMKGESLPAETRWHGIPARIGAEVGHCKLKTANCSAFPKQSRRGD